MSIFVDLINPCSNVITYKARLQHPNIKIIISSFTILFINSHSSKPLKSIILTDKHTTMATTTNESKSYFPLAGLASDGWSTEDEATATCLCGAVQLAFVSLIADPCMISQLTPSSQHKAQV